MTGGMTAIESQHMKYDTNDRFEDLGQELAGFQVVPRLDEFGKKWTSWIVGTLFKRHLHAISHSAYKDGHLHT